MVTKEYLATRGIDLVTPEHAQLILDGKDLPYDALTHEYHLVYNSLYETPEPIGDGRSPLCADNLFTERYINEIISKAIGKALTVIEATVPNEQQKAAKDLVRDQLGDLYEKVNADAYEEDTIQRLLIACNNSEFKK